jgi:hypothetical protein
MGAIDIFCDGVWHPKGAKTFTSKTHESLSPWPLAPQRSHQIFVRRQAQKSKMPSALNRLNRIIQEEDFYVYNMHNKPTNPHWAA